MGQIRKIDDVYYIEFHARGLLYSQPGGRNFEEAQRLLNQIEGKILAGESLTIARHIDLPDFFERFLSEAGVEHGPRTLIRFEGVIKHFSHFLTRDLPQIQQLSQITPAIIESYKGYLVKEQKVKIVNLTILLLRDALEYGIKLGFLNDNPALHVHLLAWPKAPDRKPTARHELVRNLLQKGIGLGKLSQLLKFPDIARALYFSNLIPIFREDVYDY